jgi:hypothetical protein
MQLMGTKHYPVGMCSNGMDDFVMDETTLKTTPGEVSREEHVGEFLRMTMCNPQRICPGG